MGARSRRPSAPHVWQDRQTYLGPDLATPMCHTDLSEGNGTEKPRQEHEGVLNEDYRASQGVAVTWTALTGRVVRCGESQWHIPHKPPNGGGEPTMRKGSYSEELVRIVVVMNTKEIDAPKDYLRRQRVESRHNGVAVPVAHREAHEDKFQL